MEALAAYGSDGSDDDSGNSNSKEIADNLTNDVVLALERNIQNGDNESVMKKSKLHQQKDIDNSELQLLPDSVTTSNNSLIHWPNNYLAEKQDQYCAAVAAAVVKCETTQSSPYVTTLTVSNEESSTVAQQLQNDHEFHNPYYFFATVDSFGLDNAFVSHIQSSTFDAWEETELERMEHEARRRLQLQSQQEQSNNNFQAVPSDFAQQQLDRAMQRHRSTR